MNRVFLVLTILLTSFRSDHAIYVSVIEMEHEQGTSGFQFSVKVFSDDLLNVLRNFDEDLVISGTDKVVTRNKKAVDLYFNQHLRVVVNGNLLKFELTGSQVENDAIFLSFKGEGPRQWKNLEIKAPYFMEVFPDQSNIVQFMCGDKSYFGRITLSNKEFTADLSD